jgi:hypothetical protein
VAADRAFADGAKAKGFLAFRSVICRENRSRKTMGYLQKTMTVAKRFGRSYKNCRFDQKVALHSPKTKDFFAVREA